MTRQWPAGAPGPVLATATAAVGRPVGAADQAGPAAEVPWTRLHPLSPLVHAGRSVVPLLLLVLPGAVGGGHDAGRAVGELGLLGVVLVLGVVSWLVTRWRVHGGDLQIKTGLVRRQSLRVPLARIQAIDVVSPALARLIGLAEVRVVVAGHGSGRTRLAYLRAGEAQRVRARLLALAHGLAEGTPEPPSRPVLRVDNGRLVLAVLLTAPTLLALALLLAEVAAAAVTGSATTASLLPLLLGVAAVPARRLNAELGFSVAEAGDGLRLRGGALQTRSETVPFGRVQGVRWIQPLLWRPFGWVRLEVDVARQSTPRRDEQEARTLSRALLPVGSREQAAWLLARVLPGAGVEPPAGSGPPRRARWRAPLGYHLLAAWDDERYVLARTGRVRPDVVVVPLDKVQSVRLTQGPLSRRLRLATVHADTAGRSWQAVARARDEDQARALVDRVAARARTARRIAAAGRR